MQLETPKIDFLSLDPSLTPDLLNFLEEEIKKNMLAPILDLYSRPSKNFRSSLVDMAFLICGGQSDNPQKLIICSLIEALHSGSLLLDDLQDQSVVRRGHPALHLIHGSANTLNAASWLLHWPMTQLKRLNLSAEKNVTLTEMLSVTIQAAHLGQALDISVRADSQEWQTMAEKCALISELKTGRLAGLGLEICALCLGAPNLIQENLRSFGSQIGIVLQIFDDLGNANGQKEPSKKFEDLKAGRLSWIWGLAPLFFSQGELKTFYSLVHQLDSPSKLDNFLKQTDFFSHAQNEALKRFDLATQHFLKNVETTLSDKEIIIFENTASKIRGQLGRAYV